MTRTFQVKTVPSRWFYETGYRLDCGPYMSGVVEAKEKINKLKVKKENLIELTKDILNVGRFTRNWVTDPDHGVPFLSSTDILQADLSNISLIAKSVVKQNPKLLIKEQTTLITRSGSIGRMAYTRSDMSGMACTEDVLRVVPAGDKVKPGYLYAYLSSKYGIPMIVSGTYGAIIQHIEPHHIADLPVPRLGNIEGQAHELVQKAAENLSKYQRNINEATNMLFEAVGQKDIKREEWHGWGRDLGFSKKLHDYNSLRALNFNPRFLKLCDLIKSKSHKTLRKICDAKSVKRGGRFLRIDGTPENSYMMVGQKQIFWLRPEGRWIAKNFIDKELISKPGTSLIAAVGTLADSERYCRAEYIWGEASKRAYSEHFYQVFPDERIMLPGCLYAFLRSESAFRMLRSISSGTKLQIQRHDFLLDLPIPYPEDDTVRLKIHNLIVDGYEKKDIAIELEDQARKLVENAIESGGS